MTLKKLLAAALPLLAVLAAAAVLAPGFRSWYVADDLLETGYAQGSDSPWAQWVHPYIGRMVYRPLTITVYYYSIARLQPIGLHLLDLGLHGLNCILLFLLIRRLWRPDPPACPYPPEPARPELVAFLGALFFAVHPLATGAAAWIACRADLLGTGFSLLALLAAASRLRPSRRLPLIGLASLAAVLAKESQLTVALAVLVVAFAREEGPWKGRVRAAALVAAPAFAVTALDLCARFSILGGLGSYEQVAPSLHGNLASMAWHLPRLFYLSFHDYLIHHFGNEPNLLAGLKAAAALLALFALPAALRRQRGLLLLGLALTLVYLMPVWNLTHMLATREDRLLYSSLVGIAIIFAAVAAAPRHPVLRPVAVAAALVVCLGFGLWSRVQVREWARVGDDNLRLARALAAYIQKDGPTATVRRFYVLGLPPEHYYLDNMVKLELSGAYRDRLILTGDQAGFFWQPKAAARVFELPAEVPPEARPQRQTHRTVPGMVFETVTPPDLIAAAGLDPGARILEWDSRSLTDHTPEMKNLFHRRSLFRLRLEQEPVWLPSFGFRLDLIPFNWTLAPGLTRLEPDQMGLPYTFVAANHDPYLVSPPLQFSALAASKLTLTMTLPARSFVPPGQDQGAIMWTSDLYPRLDPRRVIYFPIRPDGKEHEYIIDLTRNPYWPLSGDISSIRLDPIAYPATFQLIRMEFLPR